MALYTQMKEDMTSAMKQGEKQKLATIRFLAAKIQGFAKDKKIEPEKLTDDEVVTLIQQSVKNTNEELEGAVATKNQERIDKLEAEVKLLKTYLPEQLKESQIRELVINLISELGIQNKKEQGKLMAVLMPKIKGKADGKLVNQIVGEFLV